jgi:hypothetical protein
VPGLDDELREAAAKWAEETAVAQGLPARVEDLDVLRNVCELLGLSGSGPPDRAQARVVELVVAAPTGADDDVIE